jgi:hypothetical protein
MKSPLEQLELFYGDANECVASVYARLNIAPDASDYSLSGTITGPYNDYSQTLVCTISFSDQGPGESVLAKATVPDPCFWSPDSPSWYEVVVELRRDGEAVDSATREFGIRNFGRRGKDLFFNGRRWVCRGATKQWVKDAEDLSQWRDNSMVMFATQPSDSLCAATSRKGVFLVPLLVGAEEVRRAARWASVGMAMIFDDPKWPADADKLTRTALNVLIGQINHSREPITPASWSSAVLSFTAESYRKLAATCDLPVLAWGRYDEEKPENTCAEKRRECEQLQAELAPYGDFAGYIVG